MCSGVEGVGVERQLGIGTGSHHRSVGVGIVGVVEGVGVREMRRGAGSHHEFDEGVEGVVGAVCLCLVAEGGELQGSLGYSGGEIKALVLAGGVKSRLVVVVV